MIKSWCWLIHPERAIIMNRTGLSTLAMSSVHYRQTSDVRPRCDEKSTRSSFRSIRLPDAIAYANLFLLERGPTPCQIPQLLDGLRRDETTLQQAMLQKIGDPLAIFRVGFPSSQRLNLHGAGQKQFELPFQNMPHRFPVHPSGLH